MRSIAIPKFYSIWQQRLMQQIPDRCDSRLTNMIWLMMGIFQSRSVQLNLIVRKLPIRAKKLSLVMRLRRFLDNPGVRVRDWYRPLAIQLIQAAGSAGSVRLIIDASKISFGFQLLMVAIAYRGRALPLVWTWVGYRKGHSTTTKQLALLAYVRDLLPGHLKVSLVGDCEFGRPLLLEYLDSWGWDYALRQPGDHLVMTKDLPRWRRLDSILAVVNLPLWVGPVLLTQTNAYPTHLVLFWRQGEKTPWLLATNLRCPRAALQLYRRRMWIEEMFGDLKGHGFDLENSHLQHFLRLSRLTLAVCLLYVWLFATGDYVDYSDLAHLVDRTDRRDLSIFRLGWDFIERCLALNDPCPLTFFPNFCSVYGG